MKVLILAAGRGTRISRYLSGKPKCTVDIGGGQCLIEYTIDLLHSRGIQDIGIVLGYEAQVIREVLADKGVSFFYNPFYDVTNSIASAWFAKEFLTGDDLLIMNGDVYLEEKLLDRILAQGRSPVMFADESRRETADYKFFYEDGILKKYGKELTGDDVTGEYIGIGRFSAAFMPEFICRMEEMIDRQEHGVWWENVVYSMTGHWFHRIQSGYARPAIAAGKTRFVLYNRSGSELRVESRTQNLYTKTMDSTIYLCAVADAGQVAVVTDNADSAAALTVYNSSMQQQLVWNLTSEQGVPLRMAFSPDSRRLAAAAVTAVGGQLTTNLYALPLAQGDPVLLSTENSVPQWMGWLSNGFLLVIYENRAVLYNTTGGSIGERASYDFGGSTLVSVSAENNGVALLLSNGQTSTAVLLDGELTVGYSGSVLSASQIIRAKNDGFYLLTDSTVERFNNVGEFQWSQPLSARPRALVEGRQILVFTGNTVQVLTPPEQAASSGQ